MDTTSFQPSLATLSVVLLNLGCFLFFSSTISSSKTNKRKKKKKLSSITPSTPSPTPPQPSPKPKPNPHSSSLLSHINHLFSIHHYPTATPLPSPSPSPSPSPPSKRPSFASRADVFPCSACGEVFNRSHLLELHQATRHSLAELGDGDSGRDIVRIIFESGWEEGGKGEKKVPEIERVLKVQNCARTLARFEEHRQAVRARAAARAGGGRRSAEEERCMADGNERLRFYCSTCLCALARGSTLGTCGSPLCRTCEVVRNGFGGKSAEADGGVGTHATGSAAHAALPGAHKEEFAFLHARRAMFVCRVVAGRVAHGNVEEDGGAAHEYDSILVSRGGAEELVVFDPRAVLPCFVVIYRVV